jgi:predicted aconitase with swiveling domain
MSKLVLKGRRVHGGFAEGEAVVSRMGIAAYGSIDPYTGKVVERGHDLEGTEIAGKILVFKTGKGSSAWSIGAQASRFTGNNPKALVVTEANPQVALGSVVMRVPAVSDCDRDPTEVIATGDWVVVDGDNGTVEVTERGET